MAEVHTAHPFNREALAAADRKRYDEAQRLERTRPRDPRKAFQKAGKGFDEEAYEKWMATLPRGTCRVICNVICVPTPRAAAKGRRSYHAVRVVDRRVWNKLDDDARGRWIERIRKEVGA